MSIPSHAAVLLTVLALLGAACHHPSRISTLSDENGAGTTEPPRSIAQLEAMNKVFRREYAERLDEARDELGPIVVVRFRHMELWNDGALVADGGIAIPTQYFRLRACAHVPFAVYLMLAPATERPLHDRERAESAEYRGLLISARDAMDDGGFTAGQLRHQSAILDGTDRFLSDLLVSGRLGNSGLAAYLHTMRPHMMALAHDAGIGQVDAMHDQMKAWRCLLPDETWQRLRVVIVGILQARRDNVATQYFAALFDGAGSGLGYPGEGPRIYYREFVPKAPEDGPPHREWLRQNERTLLATMDLDSRASGVIFGDSTRMSIDVMADGARDYLRRLDFGELDWSPAALAAR